MLLAGKRIVVAGYGMVGMRLHAREGNGAHVIVTEVNLLHALGVMDGFEVLSMDRAAEVGDLFITATGDKSVIRREHMERMKDGHPRQHRSLQRRDRDPQALRQLATDVREARAFVGGEFTDA